MECWGPRDWAAVLTPVLLTFSLIVAAAAIWWSRHVTVLRTTYDHIQTFIKDEDIIKYFNDFWLILPALAKANERFVDVPSGSDREKELFDALREATVNSTSRGLVQQENILRFVINYYESTALAVFRGSLNENYLSRWWRATLMEDWSDLKRYIEAYRTVKARAKYAAEFQKLAEKWMRQDAPRTWPRSGAPDGSEGG